MSRGQGQCVEVRGTPEIAASHRTLRACLRLKPDIIRTQGDFYRGSDRQIYLLGIDANFSFDTQRWMKDPTLTTSGDGVPTKGGFYPVSISGLEPNDQFDLYLNDTVVLNNVPTDGTGTYDGGFVFPSNLSEYEIHFLTAQDTTGEFAYSITCPRPPTGGGIVEAAVVGYESDTPPWAFIAGGTLAATVVLIAGSWYAMKRRRCS